MPAQYRYISVHALSKIGDLLPGRGKHRLTGGVVVSLLGIGRDLPGTQVPLFLLLL
jgi:hypothetical protein